MNWSTHTEKQRITYPVIFKERCDSVLSLSGETCTDLEYALHVGAITTASHIDIIERQSQVVEKIQRKCEALRLKNFHIYRGELHSFQPLVKYDLLNIDLLGNMRSVELDWLRSVRGLINSGGTLNVTAFSAVRANTFLPTMYNFMSYGTAEMSALIGGLEKRFGWLKATNHLLLAEYVLAGRKFKANLFTYTDKTEMMMLCYQNIRPDLTPNSLRTRISKEILNQIGELK